MTDKTGAAAAPRTEPLDEMVVRWETDAEFIEKSGSGTRIRRIVAAETLRVCASDVRRYIEAAAAESGASRAAEDRGSAALPNLREVLDWAARHAVPGSVLHEQVHLANIELAALPHGEPARTPRCDFDCDACRASDGGES